MLFPSFFNAGEPTYEIEQSLRVNRDDSANMSRTFNNGGSSHTQWTFSFWTKRHVKPGTSDEIIFYTNKGSGYSRLDLGSGGGIGLSLLQYNGSSWDYAIFTNGYLRDPSAWYHMVFVYDSPNATASERLRIYLNGERQTVNTSFTEQYPSQNFASELGKDVTHYLFRGVNYGTGYYNGYAAETYFIDNQALDPTDFGELDNNGVWRPIKYTGTYGGNSFYLQYASNGIGDDSSGEGNNWTASGFTTSGTGTDVMSDTPTKNYPTINPIAALDPGEPYNITGIKNGNLDVDNVLAAGSGNNTVVATFQVPTSGKWYWEVTCREYSTAAPSRTSIGVMSNAAAYADGGDFVYANIAGVYSYAASGVKCTSPNLGTSSYGSSYGVNDVIGVAFDADNGDLYFYKNGTAQNSGTAAFTGLDMTDGFYPAVGYWGDFTFNFGQRAFEQTVPSGYKALNTANLPAPTVKDGSEYFNTVLYTGDGASSHAITGVGFQPDWVWAKQRNTSRYHNFYDSVRGADLLLQSHLTNAEIDANGTGVTSFDSDGFTVGTDSGVNQSSGTYVAWNWLAGGSVSADNNTDGSINSTVSANPTAGFSIVSYASGAAGQKTVGHGLGVAPDFIITKSRDGSTYNWGVFHSAVCDTTSKYLRLNTTDSLQTYSTIWGAALPTSTVFGITSGGGVEANDNCIAYCFAEVEGYSKFGSYTGNGSSDGPFIATSFTPQFIILKKSQSGGTGDWIIKDTARDPFNVSDSDLRANLSNAEASSSARNIDILSNGFKLRTSDGDYNDNANTFVFAAFASNPFGGSGVSPATAR